MKKYLYGHTSPETAYVVENYPWGFRQRTSIRYWIETKKGYGQRFCSQTINPKTDKWCAPKKGTYSAVIFMFLDEENHVKNEGYTFYTNVECLENAKQFHKGNLEVIQEQILDFLIKRGKKLEGVKFTSTMEEITFAVGE